MVTPSGCGARPPETPGNAFEPPCRSRARCSVARARRHGSAWRSPRSPSPARCGAPSSAPRLCETTGGGKFVRIPGFPGERIDRRLLTDIQLDRAALPDLHHRRLLVGRRPRPRTASTRSGSRSTSSPTAPRADTGADITALAHWAEPRQNHPRAAVPLGRLRRRRGPRARQPPAPLLEPLGDPGPGGPAKTVDTIRCPVPATTPPPPSEPPTAAAAQRAAGASPAPADRRRDQLRRAQRPRQRPRARRAVAAAAVRRARGRALTAAGQRGGGHRDTGARGHAGGIGRGSRGLPTSGGVKPPRSR